ncbi:hypothetical protein HYC85_015173 [Camellia sinensis]|uniref:Uncharacterized protein n=1 Tax=Camellia sinensis TaxID=4442 RepID=A0A7J7HBR0_CAMSI|nr:hypothetical protein HYC85_015173 [Camellia sinensis]
MDGFNSIEKVNVYNFGVMVLKMLRGRKNLKRTLPEEDMHLLGLFKRKVEKEQLLGIVDKYNDDMQTHRAEVSDDEGSCVVSTNFTTPVVRRAIRAAGHQEEAIGAATYSFISINFIRTVITRI